MSASIPSSRTIVLYLSYVTDGRAAQNAVARAELVMAAPQT